MDTYFNENNDTPDGFCTESCKEEFFCQCEEPRPIAFISQTDITLVCDHCDSVVSTSVE
jgi:hypothetical protein